MTSSTHQELLKVLSTAYRLILLTPLPHMDEETERTEGTSLLRVTYMAKSDLLKFSQ